MSVADAAGVVTAVVAAVALGGAYVQFIMRRSGLGYVEFDVEFTGHDRGDTKLIGELSLVIKNVGSNMVVVTNLRCRGRYRLEGDPDEGTHGVEPQFGHALGDDWFPVMTARTFIQPGVTQRYRKPVAVPGTARSLHLWGSFDYRIEARGLTRVLLGLAAQPPTDLDWREGIRNHTVRRTFGLDS